MIEIKLAEKNGVKLSNTQVNNKPNPLTKYYQIMQTAQSFYAKYLENTKGEVGAYIAVDTLKYLKKGGRVTPAAAAIGTLLNIATFDYRNEFNLKTINEFFYNVHYELFVENFGSFANVTDSVYQQRLNRLNQNLTGEHTFMNCKYRDIEWHNNHHYIP